MKRLMTLSIIEKAYLGILLVIFGGIVLHAPISVGLSTLLPGYELLIRSWKEILMGLALVPMLVLLWDKKRLSILGEPLMIAVGVYALLHLLSAAFMPQSLISTVAGVLIDLRYMLFFVLVYVAIRLYPGFRKTFLQIGVIGALVVVIFALLQVFVLPIDVLKYIGYGPDSIAPYLTVDQNDNYIRINSTLRGPNSLGAYAVVVLALLFAFWMRGDHSKLKRPLPLALILLAGGMTALWTSYSRSALIAGVFAIAVVLAVTLWHRFNRKTWIITAAIVAAIGIGLFVARDSTFVANVILHDNPTTGAPNTSNDGHLLSLQDGIRLMIQQPFGAGVGSTGSASLLGDKPLIIENQFLYIAHEVGWAGLIVFVMILIGVFARLWQRRSDWLALGVFASGIGLVLINMLLPIWVDDTVSIVWWGLAGLAIGSPMGYREEESDE